MSKWRPSPAEERWLEVGARLHGAVARESLAERAGGWRTTGPLVRVALFVLGLVATALALAILGFDSDATILVAGLGAAAAAEWLKVGRRFHASGIEEGLCVAGYLLVAIWITEQAEPLLGGLDTGLIWIVVAVAAGAAGFRLLNPLLTTCAALAFLQWIGSLSIVRTIDATAGGGTTVLVLAFAAAVVALRAGAREFQRPSHDRMLDWLIVVLPLSAYGQHAERIVMITAVGEPAPVAGTVLVSALLLAFGAASLVAGMGRRRHAPLLAFIVCVACLATELARVSAWPVEYWLVLYGSAAIVTAAMVGRYLRQPRDGITSAQLSDRTGPLDLLQTAGVAVLSQRAVPERPPSSETAREGQFGGGGASGNF